MNKKKRTYTKSMSGKKICQCCGKEVMAGFLFDSTTCLCSKECATHFFADDEGCVEILIEDGDRLVWHDKFEPKKHYRANVGHSSEDCFHHFDNEETMFEWISKTIGEKVSSYEDCENWTRKSDSYIEVIEIDDLKDFYANRREFVQKVRKSQDYMDKARKLKKCRKRDRFIKMFQDAYDDAYDLSREHPEVWHGEI